MSGSPYPPLVALQEWQKIEAYISQRSEATFSHGICPECRARIVEPELARLRDRPAP
jgi:hypothetical protein